MFKEEIIKALEDILEEAKTGEMNGIIILIARPQLPYTTYALGSFNPAYTRHALDQVAMDVTHAGQRQEESGSSRLN